MVSKTKRKTRARKRKTRRAQVPAVVKVTMARLGEALKTYPMPKGKTVRDVLEISGIDGEVTTVRLNGVVVTNLDQKITRNSEIVAVAEIDQSNFL